MYKSSPRPHDASQKTKNTRVPTRTHVDQKSTLVQQDLFDAANAGDVATVKRAIAQGKDLHATNELGDTVLMLAAFSGHRDVIDCLIGHGADIHAKNSLGETALLLAAFRGHRVCIDSLIAYGANVNEKNDYGDTALLMAASRGYNNTIGCLIRHGADVFATNSHGDNALLKASIHGNTSTIDYLINRYQLDKFSRNSIGNNALHLAAYFGHTDTVEYLLKLYMQDVSIKNNQDETAAMMAEEQGHVQLAEKLKSMEKPYSRVSAAFAQASYIARNEQELTFTKGAVLVLLEKQSDWWLCALNDITAWAPESYLVELPESLFSLMQQLPHEEAITITPSTQTAASSSSAIVTQPITLTRSRSPMPYRYTHGSSSTASCSTSTAPSAQTITLECVHAIVAAMRRLLIVYDNEKGLLRKLGDDSPEVMIIRPLYGRGLSLPADPYHAIIFHWLFELAQALTQFNPESKRASYKVIHGLKQIFPMYSQFTEIASTFRQKNIDVMNYPRVFMRYFLANYQGWRSFSDLFIFSRIEKLSTDEIVWLLNNPDSYAERMQFLNLLKVVGESNLVNDFMSNTHADLLLSMSDILTLISIEPSHAKTNTTMVLKNILVVKPALRPTQVNDIWQAFLNTIYNFNKNDSSINKRLIENKLRLHGIYQDSIIDNIYKKLDKYTGVKKLEIIDKLGELNRAGIVGDRVIDTAINHTSFSTYLAYLTLLNRLGINTLVSPVLTGEIPLNIFNMLAERHCLTAHLHELMVDYIKKHGQSKIETWLKSDNILAFTTMNQLNIYSESILHAVTNDAYPAAALRQCHTWSMLNNTLFGMLFDPIHRTLFDMRFLSHLNIDDRRQLMQGQVLELTHRAHIVELLHMTNHVKFVAPYLRGEYISICILSTIIPVRLLTVRVENMQTYADALRTEMSKFMTEAQPINFAMWWNAFVNISLFIHYQANHVERNEVLFYKQLYHNIYNKDSFDDIALLLSEYSLIDMLRAVDIMASLSKVGLLSDRLVALALRNMADAKFLPYILLIKAANAADFEQIDTLLSQDIPLVFFKALFDDGCLTMAMHTLVARYIKHKQQGHEIISLSLACIKYLKLIHQFELYDYAIIDTVINNTFNKALIDLCEAQGLLNRRMLSLILSDAAFFNNAWVQDFQNHVKGNIDLRRFNFIEVAHTYKKRGGGTNSKTIVNFLMQSLNNITSSKKKAFTSLGLSAEDAVLNRMQSAHDPGVDAARIVSVNAMYPAYQSCVTPLKVRQRLSHYERLLSNPMTSKELLDYDKTIDSNLVISSAKAAFNLFKHPQTEADRLWINLSAGDNVSNKLLFEILIFFCFEPTERHLGVTEEDALISIILMSYKLMRNYNLDELGKDNGKAASRTCPGGGSNIMVNEMSSIFHRIQMSVQNHSMASEYLPMCVCVHLSDHLTKCIQLAGTDARSLIDDLREKGLVGVVWEAIRPAVEQDIKNKFPALYGERVIMKGKTGPEQLVVLLSTVEYTPIHNVLADCETKLEALDSASSSSQPASHSTPRFGSHTSSTPHFFASYQSQASCSYEHEQSSSPSCQTQ